MLLALKPWDVSIPYGDKRIRSALLPNASKGTAIFEPVVLIFETMIDVNALLSISIFVMSPASPAPASPVYEKDYSRNLFRH